MHREFEVNILLTVHGYCPPDDLIDSVIKNMGEALMRKTVEALKEAIQIGKEINLYPEDIEVGICSHSQLSFLIIFHSIELLF